MTCYHVEAARDVRERWGVVGRTGRRAPGAQQLVSCEPRPQAARAARFFARRSGVQTVRVSVCVYVYGYPSTGSDGPDVEHTWREF